MMNNLLSIIPDHKIGQLIINDILEIAKITAVKRKKEKILLSSKHYFVSQLMYPCYEIENKFSDFDQIFQLINKYPIGKKYRETHSKERYITLLLEIHLISQVALFDRILHLINFVYDLGLSDSYVKYEIISKNSRVRNDVKKSMQKFAVYLHKSNTRSLQNKIKHKERLRDDELYYPSLIEFTIKNNLIKGNSTESLRDLGEDMKFGYRFYIKIKKEKILEEISTLKTMTLEILELIYPLIAIKYKSYRED